MPESWYSACRHAGAERSPSPRSMPFCSKCHNRMPRGPPQAKAAGAKADAVAEAGTSSAPQEQPPPRLEAKIGTSPGLQGKIFLCVSYRSFARFHVLTHLQCDAHPNAMFLYLWAKPLRPAQQLILQILFRGAALRQMEAFAVEGPGPADNVNVAVSAWSFSCPSC